MEEYQVVSREKMRRRDSQPSPPTEADLSGAALEPVLAFMQQLWSIDRGMRGLSAKMRSRIGVTGPERLILRMVGRSPGLSAGELARLLRRHPSTLTSSLDRLIQRGMLRGTVDAHDRRRLLLTLTPSGERVDRLRSGTVEAAMRRALVAIPRETLRAGSRVLTAIESELVRSLDAEDS